jgi:hypothetical protein
MLDCDELLFCDIGRSSDLLKADGKTQKTATPDQ